MEYNSKTYKNYETFKPQLESIGRYGYFFITAMVMIIAWGTYALYTQLSKGQVVTGMRDYVIWGIYDANFIFFIGISYAGALISGILHLLRVEWRHPILRMAETITVISTLIGPSYIFLSMGRLERVWHLFVYGRIQSPIVWDVIAISTYLIGSFIFLYLACVRDLAFMRDHPIGIGRWRNRIYKFMSANYRDTPKQRELLNQLIDLISIVIIPLAILVHSVLAWIFGMTLRPGWHSTIFAPYFVLAAVYSGTGVLILVMFVFRKIYHLEAVITKNHFNYLGILLMILGALYGYFTFSEYLTNWYGSVKWDMEVLYRLFDASTYWWWFFFSAFIGVLLPIGLIAMPRLRNINTIVFAALIAVTALWVKRYLIIIPTLETPLLPLHDLRPEFASYSPSWVEWSLTAMGIAIWLLLFFLFSKFLPIVPVVRVPVSEERDYFKLRKLARERILRRLISKTRKEKNVVVGIVILMILSSSLVCRAQDPVKSRLKLEFLNKSGTRMLTTKLTSKKDDQTIPLQGMQVSFFIQGEKDKVLLGKESTDEAGKATFTLPGKLDVPRNKEGKYSYSATYEGSKEFQPSESSTEIRDVFMKITFSQKDSSKLINLFAVEINQKGDSIPIEGSTVIFYVPRTFSSLKIGEQAVKSGHADLDFPVTLPGDSAGNLPVVAKFEDNDNYGSAEVSATMAWGKPLPPDVIIKRGLGDTNAPLWMVYTLIVLLSLVWFHFTYAIITIFRIRWLGNKALKEEQAQIGSK
ncbi:MAG: polysulfide reductase NrfD [Bacteroidetes bacterium]|nr:polysulfide reductase NrfD [Bacteroidota bacterium]